MILTTIMKMFMFFLQHDVGWTCWLIPGFLCFYRSLGTPDWFITAVPLDIMIYNFVYFGKLGVNKCFQILLLQMFVSKNHSMLQHWKFRLSFNSVLVNFASQSFLKISLILVLYWNHQKLECLMSVIVVRNFFWIWLLNSLYSSLGVQGFY